MGIQRNTYSYEPSSELDVSRKIDQQIEQDEREFGHQEGYSGALNSCGSLTFCDKFVLSSAEFKKLTGKDKHAEIVLQDLIQKRGLGPNKRDLIAYRVGDFQNKDYSFEHNKKLVTAMQIAQSSAMEMLRFDQSIFERAVKAKSKTRGCKCCGASYPIDALAKKHAHLISAETATVKSLNLTNRSTGSGYGYGYRMVPRYETNEQMYIRVSDGLYDVAHTLIRSDTKLRSIRLHGDGRNELTWDSRHDQLVSGVVEAEFLKCLLCGKDMFTTSTDEARRPRLIEKFLKDFTAFDKAKVSHKEAMKKKFPSQTNFWFVIGDAAC